MGILNITPDSFYDKSRFSSKDDLLKRTETILSEGATFIDVGAYSSRPGAEFVSEEEERKRLIPALEIILKEFPDVLLSVDTFRSNIARETIDLGASIINDISGGDMDSEMFDVVVKKSQTQAGSLITEGQAFSTENIVIVDGGARSALGVATHEITHIIVSRATKDSYVGVPLWLNEGLAEYGNIEQDSGYDRYLEWAVDTKKKYVRL